MEDERLYTLRTNGDDYGNGYTRFYTCRCADGVQLLLGAYAGETVLIVRFAPDGEFLSLEERPLRVTRESVEQEIRARRPDITGPVPYVMYEIAFDEATNAELRAVRDELEATPAPIRVRAFHLGDYRVG